ncbi:helix-turn-helix domain-containing protein [Aquisalimonas asiatica]|uniref:Helix-turn-helix n=1 Tax=Aquisalimonas asiatica TaxID=406100 RepID=A0A1H8VR63_9GAMM|nr:helix-turn-helix transcriptional regulator [Aquisalimonas asiatica]SEP17707.1 Helix-turn-helix [Aquisalimonas asiatica]
MTLPTQQDNGSSNVTTRFYQSWDDGEGVVAEEPVTETDSVTAKVVHIGTFAPHLRPSAVKSHDIDDIAAEFEELHPEEMADAQRWVHEALYPDEENTIRSIRMAKGLSQAALAALMDSNQPHVARIEAGRVDIAMSTARKLAAALDLDLNQLDQALLNQCSFEESRRG